MDDKQRAAMDAANPYQTPTGKWYEGDEYEAFNDGAEWMHAHDAEVDRLREAEVLVRKYLWLNHGHIHCLYGDDGEMQCCHASHGAIDFKRDPIGQILDRLANGIDITNEETLKAISAQGANKENDKCKN